MKTDREREIAIQIIDEFEHLLDKYDIDIPDKYREGNSGEGRIYGRNYYDLEASIRKILNDMIGENE